VRPVNFLDVAGCLLDEKLELTTSRMVASQAYNFPFGKVLYGI
jgi:hypothetical protein